MKQRMRKEQTKTNLQSSAALVSTFAVQHPKSLCSQAPVATTHTHTYTHHTHTSANMYTHEQAHSTRNVHQTRLQVADPWRFGTQSTESSQSAAANGQQAAGGGDGLLSKLENGSESLVLTRLSRLEPSTLFLLLIDSLSPAHFILRTCAITQPLM